MPDIGNQNLTLITRIKLIYTKQNTKQISFSYLVLTL